MKEIGKYEIIHMKVEDYLEDFEGKRFHAVLCDPPYGLEFMGEDFDTFKDKWEKYEDLWVKADGTPYHRHTDAPQYKAGLSFQSWTTEWAKLMLEAIYPGAIMMSFGGTRTWHRLACGLEDAGWELWDMLNRFWVYGSGFPKAQDIGKLIDKSMGAEREVIGQKEAGLGSGDTYAYKQMSEGIEANGTVDVTAPATPEAKIWDGYKTPAIKPAWEPIICVRAPRGNKSYAELALKHGSGCLNVDGGRIKYHGEVPNVGGRPQHGRGDGYGFEPLGDETDPNLEGRYPPNLILECTCEEVIPGKVGTPYVSHNTNVPSIYEKGFEGKPKAMLRQGRDTAPIHTNPNCPAYMLDAQSEESVSHGGRIGKKAYRVIKYAPAGNFRKGDPGFGDRGGSSRFFYVAKAHRTEREAGLRGVIPCAVCGELKSKTHLDEDGNELSCIRNQHPTIKPILLNEWLAKLLLPPKEIGERRLFIPFSGAGSEMIGALKAGWDYVVGVEMNEDYVEIAKARLKFWIDYQNINVLDKKKYRMYKPERADKFW